MESIAHIIRCTRTFLNNIKYSRYIVYKIILNIAKNLNSKINNKLTFLVFRSDQNSRFLRK